MPGIVKGEVASCARPLLPFFYQEEGILVDLYSLRYEVYPAGSTVLKASGTINQDGCDVGGNRVSAGYYVAPLDSSLLDQGCHEIVWFYKTTGSSEELQLSYKFEVLNPAKFRTGIGYEAYVGSDHPLLDPFPMDDRQRFLQVVSREVDRLTGRFFFPKFITLKHSVRPPSSIIWVDQPIIGLASVVFESSGVVSSTLTETDVELEDLRIFNRHLAGVITPDDRDNPKIGFARVGRVVDLIEPPIFPTGLKNIKVEGVFGYTDPDGGPFGMVPLPLQEVVERLTYRRIVDPGGTDIMLQDPNRVKKAKTRDQEIQFDTSGYSSGSSMTGDARLDDILYDYFRPAHVGVAG